jgi:hypothetical protein
MVLRKAIIITILLILFTGIGIFFWHYEFVYSLPTPVPINYRPVNFGNKVAIPESLYSNNSKPVFLHFFNPDCPCSKFNINHFKSLVKQYGDKVNFAIVVINNDKYTTEELQNKFNVKIPVLFDKSIAAACGVYSTPQAVIIDNNHSLYYRGNYNRARYCIDTKSNYAQQALDSLLHHHSIIFNQFALKAYGCQLPQCTR